MLAPDAMIVRRKGLLLIERLGSFIVFPVLIMRLAFYSFLICSCNKKMYRKTLGGNCDNSADTV